MTAPAPAPDQVAALVIAQEHCRVTGHQYIAALLKHGFGAEASAALNAFAQANEDVGKAFREATT